MPRVAFVLRSTEVQPVFFWFVVYPPFGQRPREVARLSERGGREKREGERERERTRDEREREGRGGERRSDREEREVGYRKRGDVVGMRACGESATRMWQERGRKLKCPRAGGGATRLGGEVADD